MAPRRLRHSSTYRLQFRPEFGFTAARAIVPYLADLGITAVYSSPQLAATPGSTHGYDICDHSRLNPDLGTADDYAAFSQALRDADVGHLIDIVPNHMAADPSRNRWWRDVLENGPSSPYSDFFDVDWAPTKPELKGRVLLPVLGDQYGLVLERGDLQLRFADGTLELLCGGPEGLNLPINPRQIPRVLGLAAARVGHALTEPEADAREYLSIMTALENLPHYTERDVARVEERQREKDVARDRLRRLAGLSPNVRAHIAACLRYANGSPGDPSSFDVLHDLLEHQAYRLAYWRTAFDEINYRRFFDVNGLVALRVEDRRVFDATHALIRDLVHAGHVTGFRVDHPDGLFDPETYLERLQELAGGDFYILVEKILSEGESLNERWPVAGTTGYDFLNQVGGLWVDGRNAAPLRRAYARLTGRQETFDQEAYQGKRVITLTSMASELNVLAHGLNRLSESDRRHRDFTLDSCRKTLREVLACMPVYRTYVSERGWTEFDREVIDTAIRDAAERNPLMEDSLFAFIREVLLSQPPLRFAMKFQQFSGPVQAKGVEDTAFYRYHVLDAVNDVGGHPGHLRGSVDAFHQANQARRAKRPLEMLATSTHDTKRGEDARARLSVLSELPDAWRKHASDWMRMNARHRTKIHSLWAPDRNDEYLFYQAALGAWPMEFASAPVPETAPAAFVQRINTFMQKAIREAKVHTSWIDQDPGYSDAVARFVSRVLAGEGAKRFLTSFVPFARRLSVPGAINALAQVAIKIAAPGVPDFYQGSELWELSLVDPDNRRLVDYEHRRALLASLTPLIAHAEGENPTTAGADLDDVVSSWTDGRVKMLVTACGLRFRRRHADFMTSASYEPLVVEGPRADQVVAFLRAGPDGAGSDGNLVLIAPRLVAGLTSGDTLHCGDAAWADTRVRLPERFASAARSSLAFRDVVTGAAVAMTENVPGIDIARAWARLPVALLWSRTAGSK